MNDEARQEAAVDALLAAVRAEFGERLDEAGVARVREQLRGVVANRAALAAASLANGDEPGSVFAAMPPGRDG